MSRQLCIDDPLAEWKLCHFLLAGMKEAGFNPQKETVILCIGSDRSTGDSLGPLVGTYLSRFSLSEKRKILGTLEQPVHASNLLEALASIYGPVCSDAAASCELPEKHGCRQRSSAPFVIAVDACLGKPEKVGWITVAPGPLRPGAGVNKSLPPVGDLHISGTVNVGGFMEFFVLQSTRLSLVMRMAEQIARGIRLALKNYERLPCFSLSGVPASASASAPAAAPAALSAAPPAPALRNSLITVSSGVGPKET